MIGRAAHAHQAEGIEIVGVWIFCVAAACHLFPPLPFCTTAAV